ncbi:MAG: 3-hydroxyacyl-CoA dehydrogenase NAD-binding domain-containing protein [Boseongicola sp.]
MTADLPFQNIAVIGAGTMGAAIAGQIANAGHKVLLLDLPGDAEPNSATSAAVQRLIKSDPPALMHKSRADLIQIGNIRDDFDKLSACDWIVEAVVERLPIKKDLYERLNTVIRDDCVVTSNTSTIPIKLLVEDMPLAFRKRFAITHYFNPVRYMRLLELVTGEDTDTDIIARLADYNDRFLGKGVVECRDTPGFLGNRVGVFALQVGMEEAYTQSLTIEEADALMGRPMGIPKTGVFGLYDLIGVDLMSDVVKTLEVILPDNDAFRRVGEKNSVSGLISEMIAAGFTGDKGKGGFYRSDSTGHDLAIDIHTAQTRTRISQLPPKALRAAESIAQNKEPLLDLIQSTDDGDEAQTIFCRNVLARVLAYAADLIPNITESPQDIDDAMKLGFNWIRGPFEMMDAIGRLKMRELISKAGLAIPSVLEQDAPFYEGNAGVLHVRRFATRDDFGTSGPVKLPEGTIRFSMTRRCLEPILSNNSASLYALEDNVRLVEFHSKANALTDDSVAVLAAASDDPGRGIIIHNDAQHYSAGVDLNAFLTMIRAKDWEGIDEFLIRFQMAAKGLRDAPVPVIAAPSGLTLGGGFEVVMHADKVIAHANSVMGLVEASVGLVPSGGGVKETFARWHRASGDWRKSAWNTWLQVGYSNTGTSPEISARYQYFLTDHDQSVMNRDKLLGIALAEIEKMNSEGYVPLKSYEFDLQGEGLLDEMDAFMDKGISENTFFPHDKIVAMAVAEIVAQPGSDAVKATEDELFDRERRAFLSLAKTPETEARISSLLETGSAKRN